MNRAVSRTILNGSVRIGKTAIQERSIDDAFFRKVEQCEGMLRISTGIQREQHLRHLRRIMTDTVACCHSMKLTVVTLLFCERNRAVEIIRRYLFLPYIFLHQTRDT